MLSDAPLCPESPVQAVFRAPASINILIDPPPVNRHAMNPLKGILRES